MAIIVHPTAPLAGRLMALIAVGLGLGRIRAGLHYPSDVLAGVALGALVGRRLSPARVQS
jgi:membrane-associated phospholipid phosphatase